MRCPFCAAWADPSGCGHCLLGGVLVPPGLVNRDAETFGCARVWGNVRAENLGSRLLREQHIERQVMYADQGGW